MNNHIHIIIIIITAELPIIINCVDGGNDDALRERPFSRLRIERTYIESLE